MLLLALLYLVAAQPQLELLHHTSPITQFSWCGAPVVYTNDDDVVEQDGVDWNQPHLTLFVLTRDGHVLREGTDLEISFPVESMQVAPSESGTLYLFGESQILRLDDCNPNTNATSNPNLTSFHLNKVNSSWILGTRIDENGIYEVMVTQNSGATWVGMLKDVR